MIGALGKSFLFGLVVAGSIGPIALLIFGTAARQGLAPGLAAGAGAALADLGYALVAFLLGALLLPLLGAQGGAIRAACALLLVALGAWMLIGALRRGGEAPAAAQTGGHARWLAGTFLLTVVNPMTIVVFTGFVPQLPVSGSPARAAALAAALFAGSLVVNLGIAVAGAALGAALPGAGWRRAISVLSGAGILAFGIAGLAGA